MKMKGILSLFITVALLPINNAAQVISMEKTLLNTNLFEEFTQGSVHMKDGRTEQALLNYDSENQSIVFKNNGQVLILTDLQSVDTVYIRGRKFLPVDNKFYEVLTETGNIELFVTYSNKRKPVTASPDHDGVKRSAGNQVNNNVATAYVSRPNQLNYQVQILPQYWLKRGNSFYKSNNESQLLKVFPLKDRDSIKKYIEENKINFNEPDNIAKLVNYCNNLLK